MADDALDRLCRQFGIDRDAAGRAVQASAGDDAPWYFCLATGVGAWLTAVAMIAAVGLVLAEVFGDNESLPMTATIAGGLIAAGGVALHRSGRGPFATQYAIAVTFAGQALVIGGLAAEFESMVLAAAVACAAAAALVPAVRDPEHQFLSCGLAVGVVLAALVIEEAPRPGGVLVLLTLPPAVVLLLRPVRAPDLRGLAWALLLAPLAALSVPEVGGLGGDWLPGAAYAAGLVGVLAPMWRRTGAGSRAVLAIAVAVAGLLGVVTAGGIAGSLLLLAMAYLLGSRMLAALGAVAQVWFLSRFYYDLDLTLLQKSGMLVAAGLLLLVLWWAWSRAVRAEVADG